MVPWIADEVDIGEGCYNNKGYSQSWEGLKRSHLSLSYCQWKDVNFYDKLCQEYPHIRTMKLILKFLAFLGSAYSTITTK
jgi:hypothetical protein